MGIFDIVKDGSLADSVASDKPISLAGRIAMPYPAQTPAESSGIFDLPKVSNTGVGIFSTRPSVNDAVSSLPETSTPKKTFSQEFDTIGNTIAGTMTSLASGFAKHFGDIINTVGGSGARILNKILPIDSPKEQFDTVANVSKDAGSRASAVSSSILTPDVSNIADPSKLGDFLSTQKESLDTKQSELQGIKSRIDSLIASGDPASADEYNRLVGTFNDKKNAMQSDLDRFNHGINTYNNIIKTNAPGESQAIKYGPIMRASEGLGAFIADLPAFAAGGELTEATRIPELLGNLASKVPAIGSYLGPILENTVKNLGSFSAASQPFASADNPNSKNPHWDQLKKDIGASAVFALPGAIPKQVLAVPVTGVLAYGLAKLSGASTADATVSAVLMGALHTAGLLGDKKVASLDEAKQKIIQHSIDTINKYAVNKINLDSTPEQIDRAFKQASLKTHPDVGGKEEDFKAVSWARDYLKNEYKTRQVQVSDAPTKEDLTAIAKDFKERNFPKESNPEVKAAMDKIAAGFRQKASEPVSVPENPDNSTFDIVEKDPRGGGDTGDKKVVFRTTRGGKEIADIYLKSEDSPSAGTGGSPAGYVYTETLDIPKAQEKFQTTDPETLANRIVNPHDGYDVQTEKYTTESTRKSSLQLDESGKQIDTTNYGTTDTSAGNGRLREGIKREGHDDTGSSRRMGGGIRGDLMEAAGRLSGHAGEDGEGAKLLAQHGQSLSDGKSTPVDDQSVAILREAGFPSAITDKLSDAQKAGGVKNVVITESHEGNSDYVGAYKADTLYLNPTQIDHPSYQDGSIVNHEIAGHSWYLKLDQDARRSFYNDVKDNKTALKQAWEGSDNPHKGYWARTVAQIREKVLFKSNEAITARIMDDFGLVANGQMSLDSFIDESLNLDKTIVAINAELARIGRDPIDLEAHNTQSVQEHVAMLAERAGDVTGATPAIENYLSDVEAGTLKYGSQVILAPNGEKSKLNPIQYQIVRTPEFKNWFGDWENDPKNSSKIVDENGEPLVVYHGSNSEKIDEFNPKLIGNRDSSWFGKGFYFALSKEEASSYGKNITDAFLNIKNPFDFSKYNFPGYTGYSIADTYTLSSMSDDVKGLNNAIKGDIYGIGNESTGHSKIAKEITLGTYKKMVAQENLTPRPTEINDRGKVTISYEYNDIYGNERWYDTHGNKPIPNELLKYVLFDEKHGTDFGVGGLYGVERKIAENYGNGFTEELKELGHDGTIQSPDGDEYVAFKPNQIKSASKNSTFGETNNIAFREKNPEFNSGDPLKDVRDTLAHAERRVGSKSVDPVKLENMLSREKESLAAYEKNPTMHQKAYGRNKKPVYEAKIQELEDRLDAVQSVQDATVSKVRVLDRDIDVPREIQARQIDLAIESNGKKPSPDLEARQDKLAGDLRTVVKIVEESIPNAAELAERAVLEAKEKKYGFTIPEYDEKSPLANIGDMVGIEDTLNRHPAKPFMKYVNPRTGILPAIREDFPGVYGKEMTALLKKKGYDSVADAQKAVENFQAYVDVLEQMSEDRFRPIEMVSSPTVTETNAFELEKARLAVPGAQPFETMALQSDTIPARKKVGIHDYMRTPDRVLKKIGLGNESDLIKKQYASYLKELPENIDKITDWAKRTPRPGASERIFDYLDGYVGEDGFMKTEPLPLEELKVAEEIKAWLKDWAIRLGLKPHETLTNYITHIFEDDLIKKEFDQDLAKIIQGKVAGQVYDPFLEKRLGHLGYVHDAWRALDAYVKRATRKVYMDVALEQMKIAAKDLDIESYNYVNKYVDRINLRPTNADNLVDNTLKQIFGYRMGQRPLARISKSARQLVFRGTLGLNIGSAVKNLTQGVNTYAKLGEKYTLIGYSKLVGGLNQQELIDEGILNADIVQDRALSSTKKFWEKTDKMLFYLFETVEKINRGAAYFGAKAKYIAQNSSTENGIEIWKDGTSMEKAKAYAKKMVEDTQFTFGSIDTPVALQSDIAKTLLQFQSFNVKQAEFLAEMAKNKNYAGLIRYIVASLAVLFGIGKLFGYKWTDMIPFSKYGLPPLVSGPLAIFKAAVGAKDSFGNQPSPTKRLENAGNAVLPFIPSGIQASKTIRGLKSSSLSDSGIHRVRAGIFGPVKDANSDKIVAAISKNAAGSKTKLDAIDPSISGPAEDAWKKVKKAGAGTKEGDGVTSKLTKQEYDAYTLVKAADLDYQIKIAQKVAPIVEEASRLGYGTKEADALVKPLNKEEYRIYTSAKNAIQDSDPKFDNQSLTQHIAVYAKALGTSPETAFDDFIHGDWKIVEQKNGQIIVTRAPQSKTDAIKASTLQKNKNFKLDHTVPLEVGGTNRGSNLQILTTAQWASNTKVEDYLGTALDQGKITGKQAREYIIRFKQGLSEPMSDELKKEYTDKYGSIPLTFEQIKELVK